MKYIILLTSTNLRWRNKGAIMLIEKSETSGMEEITVPDEDLEYAEKYTGRLSKTKGAAPE